MEVKTNWCISMFYKVGTKEEFAGKYIFTKSIFK